MVGGWGKFGSGAILSKTFQILPNYDLRLAVTMFSIENFNEKLFQIKVNGNILYSGAYPSSGIWKGDVCAGYNYQESYNKIYLTLPNNILSIFLEFTSTLTVSANQGSWGINNLVLIYSKCHPTCLTCLGPASNDCLSCYPNFNYNGVSKTCLCPIISFYFLPYTTPCLIYPCSKLSIMPFKL